MERLTIIVGTSIFSGGSVVGMALRGQVDAIGMTVWADQHGKSGRPATVEPLNGYKSEADAIARMRATWESWAAKEGLQIQIAPRVRRVKSAF